jgi:hypothetical protein
MKQIAEIPRFGKNCEISHRLSHGQKAAASCRSPKKGTVGNKLRDTPSRSRKANAENGMEYRKTIIAESDPKTPPPKGDNEAPGTQNGKHEYLAGPNDGGHPTATGGASPTRGG